MKKHGEAHYCNNSQLQVWSDIRYTSRIQNYLRERLGYQGDIVLNLVSPSIEELWGAHLQNLRTSLSYLERSVKRSHGKLCLNQYYSADWE